MKLGYEYDYKQGDESTTDFSFLAQGNQRNIAPSAASLGCQVTGTRRPMLSVHSIMNGSGFRYPVTRSTLLRRSLSGIT